MWANLGGIELKPLVADAAFLKALPGKLGPGLEELQLKGGAELLVKHLVVLTPPDRPLRPSKQASAVRVAVARHPRRSRRAPPPSPTRWSISTPR